MNDERERLERLLGGQALRPFRERARRRMMGPSSLDVITFTRLAPEERRALESLLGRRARSADSLRVALSELDDALSRAGLAASFRQALELLDGPIPDLQGQRLARVEAWDATFAEASEPRLVRFLATSDGRGLVRRLSRADPERAGTILEQTARVLAHLPARGIPRSQLAAEVLGDAHGLDAARPVATLVLALLRTDESERDRDRETWARMGVLVNELAAPALLLNVPAEPTTLVARLAAQALEAGEPLHVSLRVLLREPIRWRVAGRAVFVCENANFVAIAASRLGPTCAPLVCTDGMPSASQRVLLQQLADSGARLFVHSDFDWPGIHIANFVIRSLGAEPWCMGAADYHGADGRPLDGTPVEASWDPELAPRMAAEGYVLEEERMADVLVESLRQSHADADPRGLPT